VKEGDDGNMREGIVGGGEEGCGCEREGGMGGGKEVEGDR